MDSQDGTDSVGLESSLNKATTDRIHSTGGKKLAPVETAEVAYREYQLIGREKERSEIIKLISGKSSQQREVISKRGGDRTKLGIKPSLAGPLEGKTYLIVLDDLSSTTEWDAIIEHFPTTETASRIIITTRVESIAKHCSKKDENIYMLKGLGDKDACDLLTEKKSFQVEELCLNFQQVIFPSLKALELAFLDNLKSVEFGAGAMPKLEQLFFCWLAGQNRHCVVSWARTSSKLQGIFLVQW
ncbi:hypothetical protein C2845_PM14G21380 [Panicum miliaceum]|uniref:NB-ARC domain-containing protein n=1 Tax=Panicum miliaceum TaxID=4540 RepID=A0A3L6PTJ2_PANMI|nr:hypothetical protein C2845_PM14G21380 [Panicum miliaceum]